MVDPGAEVVDLVEGDAQPVGDVRGRVLHAVAETDRLDRRRPVHRHAEHRHRVRVVEEEDVRADLLHRPPEIEHHRDGAQGAHDAADAQGVADRLAQTVALRDLEVDHRRRPVAADLDHVDRVVRSIQRRAQIGGRLDRRVGAGSSAPAAWPPPRCRPGAPDRCPSSAIVESCSSGKVKRSCNRFRAKTVLPAPMNAILATADLFVRRRKHVLGLGVEALRFSCVMSHS